MRLASRLQAFALFPLLVACSNALPQGTCARAQAITDNARVRSVENDASILTNAGLPRNTPGGYLDVDSYVDKETGRVLLNYEEALAQGKAIKKTRRCTAIVSFDKGATADSIRVWTADHCVQPGSDIAMRLQLYGMGGYSTVAVHSDLFGLVQRARSESMSLRPAARALFLSAFNTHETVASKSGARACKALQSSYSPGGALFTSKLAQNSTTRADSPRDYSHACFSMADLSTFRLKLASPVSSFNAEQARVWQDSRANYEKLRNYYTLIQSDQTTLQDFSVRLGEELFYSAFNELMNVRRQEAFLGFNESVAAGRCALDSSACEAGEGDKLKALAARYFDKRNFYENDLAEKLTQVSSGQFDLTRAFLDVAPALLADVGLGLATGKAEGRERFRVASDILWRGIEAGASALSSAPQPLPDNARRIRQRFQYTFQANVHPEGRPSEVRWRWLSTFRSFADNNRSQDDGHKIILGLHDNEDPFSRVMILSSHRRESPYRFEKGDSGTATGVFVFPFGVLSTVDWEETEGIPVTTLPRAGTYDDGPVAVAGGRRGAASGPGTDASGPGGSTDNGNAEVAGGGNRQGNNEECL